MPDPNPCPVCAEPLDRLVARKDKYSYWFCRGCTHVTALPKPSPEEINAFYDGFLFGMPPEREFNALVSRTCASVERILDDIRDIVPRRHPLRVLDWGGGTGFYANGFAQAGLDVTMVDIDTQACDYARSRFGEHVQVVNADPLGYAFGGEFDLIYCNQVIEHYVEPLQLAETMRHLLAPGGLAIVTTPNQRCKEFFFRPGWWLAYLRVSQLGLPWAVVRFLRRPWICCDPPRHMHAFNRASLTALLKRADLQVHTTFSESSLRPYYSTGFSSPLDFRLSSWRSPARILVELCCRAGLNLLDLVDRGRSWGDNLVVISGRPTAAESSPRSAAHRRTLQGS